MYLKKGESIVVETGATTHLKKLPNKNFLMLWDGDRYVLSPVPRRKLPDRLYGDLEETAEFFVNDFKTDGGNVGVWLYGLKGCGKSLLADLIIDKSNLPVITIAEPHTGDLFRKTLATIKDTCIVLLNEFEKVYKDDTQDEFLTILDGQYGGRKLFIIVTNENTLTDALVNRTGRIRLSKAFSGLSMDEVEEIVDGELSGDYSGCKGDIMEISHLLGTPTPDNVINLVKQVNKTGLPPYDVLKFLNIRIEHQEFMAKAIIDGSLINAAISYNPLLTGHLELSYIKEVNGRKRYKFYSTPIKELTRSLHRGKLRFIDNDGNEVTLTPIRKQGNEMGSII